LAGSSFDPVLAVYTGGTIANLQPVAASTNDIVNNLQANVNFNAKESVTYRIAIAGYDPNGIGDLRLRLARGRFPDPHGPVATNSNPPLESLFTPSVVHLT